jgi:radical SAM protein with 4Fe4S-binding SPASM domain
MSEDHRVIGMIPFDPQHHALGYANLPGDEALLRRTVDRLRQCERLADIVVVHPAGRAPAAIEGATPIAAHGEVYDTHHAVQVAARKLSPAAWRGGIGGATCYDEVLCPAAMCQAMAAANAPAALVVGADWCDADVKLCDAVVARHLEQPDEFRMVFTQAPPGKCGIVLSLSLLEEMRDNGVSVGAMLDYNPRYPQGDPIARDMCVQIPADLRSACRRFTATEKRWQGPATGPQVVTLELTPQRPCTGPITPQHYANFERGPIDLATAKRVFEQLGHEVDTTVILGGIGDALVHPQWQAIVAAARDAGLWGVVLRTDLQDEALQEELGRRLQQCSADAVIVNLNADEPATYEKLMGPDGLDVARGHIQWLLNHREQAPTPGLPWIVPAMVKTPDNVTELESFVDRWVYFTGTVLVEGPSTGGGRMPDMAVLDMAPPVRCACRQLHTRMTLLSDGTVARCDQDWQASAAIGHVDDAPLTELWAKLQRLRADHEAGAYDGPCKECREWHRP